MSSITFKPKQVTKGLIGVLGERAYDVISSRFGLDDSNRQTLESIGQKYGITRERVRQIENFALQSIKKSEAYRKEQEALLELHRTIDELGAVLPEDDLLTALSQDESTRNHLYFFLVLGDPFVREKENDDLKHRWHIDESLAEKIYDALRKIYSGLSGDELISENDMIDTFLSHLKDVSDKYKNEEIARRWLALSKKIGRNQFGEWGRADSSNIRTRGIRDHAYLVIRRHGSPMHFREGAEAITKNFERKA